MKKYKHVLLNSVLAMSFSALYSCGGGGGSGGDRINDKGVITNYYTSTIDVSNLAVAPMNIVVDGEGAIYYDSNGIFIIKRSADGKSYTTVATNSTYGFTVDGSNNLYYNSNGSGSIGRRSSNGTVTEFRRNNSFNFEDPNNNKSIDRIDSIAYVDRNKVWAYGPVEGQIYEFTLANGSGVESDENSVCKLVWGSMNRDRDFVPGIADCAARVDFDISSITANTFSGITMVRSSNGDMYLIRIGRNLVYKLSFTATQGNACIFAGVKNDTTNITYCSGVTADNTSKLNDPKGVAVDNSYVYVADAGSHRIMRFTHDGVLAGVFGTGVAGLSDGNTDVKFNSPSVVFVDNAGNIYVGDSGNKRIRLIKKQ